MRAVVYRAYGEQPVVEDVAEPACPAGGVVVEVAATGVCRSDWHAWQGHDPVPLPMVPGHEFAGTLVEVGAEVAGWSVGDRVTVPFVVACGRCAWCAAGEQQVCPDQVQPGFTYPGSWAERVAVPAAATNLVRVPDGLALDAAAALGCRFATSYRALTVHGGLRAGQHLAVHGCGGVGLSAVMVGVALGAHVVATDLDPAAREAACALGAEVLDPAAVPVADAVRDATGGGAHVSVDAVGSPATAAASVRSLRRRGRHVQVGLLLGDQAAPPLPMDVVVAHELTVVGSHGMAAHEYPAMLDLVAAGTLDPAALVTRRIPLAEAPAAMAALGTPGAACPGITVVVPGRR
ncbi:alcohol dehydrogenase catalytic domain-containing protein [Nocardioides sp. zg-579]|uniref:Alcohol dehydrogenase catalytic domain-containing protein n=1 Tax=Nocardioides marmotae TaxID=2663857 RepID=A0A6I3JET0_9ACTN|nr:alcohol dehydrogenase catalytic domain-containing protein [Nocardioides marmotae]MCR6032971.1 alcohol dehydrogenase catalytic domain-containing protein [Gordonia jinghuaiqii]MTB96622.1 alcohol dehydrogenase catalytic domain-containing protein [Nocardioides marmotae]QKE01866.1 alcohol dehydrogenase catalytic domain-containing protein [Nocardioides marmotae]